MVLWCSWSRTMARASTCSTPTSCSGCSSVSIRRPSSRAPVSGSPPCAASLPGTAAGSGPKARSIKARHSTSRCKGGSCEPRKDSARGGQPRRRDLDDAGAQEPQHHERGGRGAGRGRGHRLSLWHEGPSRSRRPAGRCAARPQAPQGQWHGGAAAYPLRGAHAALAGRDPDLLGRGARCHGWLQPRREQLRPQTGRLRGIHQGRAATGPLLAAHESSATVAPSPLSPGPQPPHAAATIRILMVEDDPNDAALAEREIRRADIVATFLRVETREGMLAALREFTPDIILTDHSLPAFGAADALEIAQQNSPGTPVIVVTGRLGDESAVQYLQAGAADYVVKDHLHRLSPAVLRALNVRQSRDAQARAYQLQAATYRIAQVAMSAPGLDELLPTIHQIVGELMPAKNIYIALYDEATELLTFPYYVDEVDPPPAPRRLGRGITEYVLRTGRPLLVKPESQQNLDYLGAVESIGTASVDWLGVLLKQADRTIGVLAVQTYTAGVRYEEHHKEMLQFVSTQVAAAIERTRAEQALRASEARLTAILRSALDAHVAMDDAGRVTSWNQQAESMFGWGEQEVLGQRLADIIVPHAHREAHA